MKINEVEISILKLPFHYNDNCKIFYNFFDGIFIVKNVTYFITGKNKN